MANDDIKLLSAGELDGIVGILATPPHSVRRHWLSEDEELLQRLVLTARVGLKPVTDDEGMRAYMLTTKLRMENDGVLSVRIARAALEDFVRTRSGRREDVSSKASER